VRAPEVAHPRRLHLPPQGSLALAEGPLGLIGKLENGERLPRIDTLIKLAGALALPPERLLDGIAWEPGCPREVGRFELGRFEPAVEGN
jgi:transcriptional regulator with XRE-family HTH domain